MFSVHLYQHKSSKVASSNYVASDQPVSFLLCCDFLNSICTRPDCLLFNCTGVRHFSQFVDSCRFSLTWFEPGSQLLVNVTAVTGNACCHISNWLSAMSDNIWCKSIMLTSDCIMHLFGSPHWNTCVPTGPWLTSGTCELCNLKFETYGKSIGPNCFCHLHWYLNLIYRWYKWMQQLSQLDRWSMHTTQQNTHQCLLLYTFHNHQELVLHIMIAIWVLVMQQKELRMQFGRGPTTHVFGRVLL